MISNFIISLDKLAVSFLIILVISFTAYGKPSIPSSRRSVNAIKRVTPRLKAELAKKKLLLGMPIFIRIFKKSKELEIWMELAGQFRLFKKYKICTYGWGSLGPKLSQGDGQAPEGFYFVKPNQLNPYSTFHLSFNIGYPNKYDRFLKRTGAALMVHGDCVSIGCYAMTDGVIEEIYTLADAAFRKNQKFFRIHIFPFRMENKKMIEYKNSPWIDFWQNLKEGYDFFNTRKRPPNVIIKNGRYVFEPS